MSLGGGRSDGVFLLLRGDAGLRLESLLRLGVRLLLLHLHRFFSGPLLRGVESLSFLLEYFLTDFLMAREGFFIELAGAGGTLDQMTGFTFS